MKMQAINSRPKGPADEFVVDRGSALHRFLIFVGNFWKHLIFVLSAVTVPGGICRLTRESLKITFQTEVDQFRS